MKIIVGRQPFPSVLLLILAACLAPAVWLFVADVHASPAPSRAAAPQHLLALARDPAANREVLAAVDQTTGTLSPLGAGLDACCTTSVLDAALDTAGSKYYAIMTRSGESVPRVMAFDTQTGQAAYSPPLTDTLAINYLAYDPASSQLLALSFSVDTLTTQVMWIDPLTGVATVLNTLANCCTPRAFDAAYAAQTRRLYAAVTFYDGTTHTRLLTISGANGAVLADAPLSDAPAINYMAYDGSSGTLWAVVYDAANDAERLARIDPVTGAITPLGDGAASCCALLVTDVGVDPAAGVLAAPMIDTSDPDADDIPRFYRYRLADGAVLSSPPLDPDYELHYIAFAAPLTAPPTGTPTTTATATVAPTVTGTPIVMPTLTVTPTPLPPKLYLPAIDSTD